MDTIVTAPGSLGDVNPMLAIARQLQLQGRSVVFLAAERYLPLAEKAGLDTRSLVSEQQFAKVLNNPQLWKPMHGAKIILREVVGDYLESHYDWLESNYRPGETMLVSHVLDFAGRIFRDVHPEAFLTSVVLAPAILRSSASPPRLTGHFWEPAIPRLLRPAAYWLADRGIDLLAGGEINRLRKKVGLSPVRSLLKSWWLSPDLILGMFPDWFSIPQQDLPKQMKLVGFPLADSGDLISAHEQDELNRTLELLSGQPRIVFAPGTAHVHAAEFLNIANQVCEKLGQPGILISTSASQIPKHISSRVAAAKYLPFRSLLPKSLAIVHHGGVGTTSQSFAAGIPQLVLPMAFDQFDNASRVRNLGCGHWFPMRKLDRPLLQRTLERLLGDQQIRLAAQRVSRQVAEYPNGACQAADEIIAAWNKR